MLTFIWFVRYNEKLVIDFVVTAIFAVASLYGGAGGTAFKKNQRRRLKA